MGLGKKIMDLKKKIMNLKKIMKFIILFNDLLFVPMSALAGYKHLKVALNGQSTVIFSKRRKISSI